MRGKLTQTKPSGVPSLRYSPLLWLCQFLLPEELYGLRNGEALTPDSNSAGASRINEEDAPNPRVSMLSTNTLKNAP